MEEGTRDGVVVVGGAVQGATVGRLAMEKAEGSPGLSDGLEFSGLSVEEQLVWCCSSVEWRSPSVQGWEASSGLGGASLLSASAVSHLAVVF